MPEAEARRQGVLLLLLVLLREALELHVGYKTGAPQRKPILNLKRERKRKRRAVVEERCAEAVETVDTNAKVGRAARVVAGAPRQERGEWASSIGQHVGGAFRLRCEHEPDEHHERHAPPPPRRQQGQASVVLPGALVA